MWLFWNWEMLKRFTPHGRRLADLHEIACFRSPVPRRFMHSSTR